MPLIDEVISMKSQGMEDKEIAKTLRERDFSPKEITDALSQSKIKAAVSGEQPMQESMMSSGPAPYPQDQQYAQYPADQQYAQQDQQYAYPAADTETIKEIAEEVAEEKVVKLREELSTASQIKKDVETKIELLEKRIEKIEKVMDKLQLAILERISSYSKDLKSVTSELRATQNSFKKVLNPTISRIKSSTSKPIRKLKKK